MHLYPPDLAQSLDRKTSKNQSSSIQSSNQRYKLSQFRGKKRLTIIREPLGRPRYAHSSGRLGIGCFAKSQPFKKHGRKTTYNSPRNEASVQVPTFPTPVQAALMVRNRSCRRVMDPFLEEFRAFRQFAAAISAIYGGDFDQPDEEEVQFCSCRVEDFVRTLARRHR